MADIEALAAIFSVGTRAHWNIVISPKTIGELSDTRDAALCEHLVRFGGELFAYATENGLTDEDHRHASDLARRLVGSPFLAPLPDEADRELIAHAVAYGCDAFCTRDVRSIHRKRDQLRSVPLRILTPREWWQHIRPWATLWL